MAAGSQRIQILRQEAGRLAGVGCGSPGPVILVAPVGGVGEGRRDAAVGGAVGSSADVVEVQVGQQDIGHVGGGDTEFGQGSEQGLVAVRVEVAAEALVLLVAHARIDEDGAVVRADEQAAGGPPAQIVGVGRVDARPHGLRDDAEHGAAVELEEAGVDEVDPHRPKPMPFFGSADFFLRAAIRSAATAHSTPLLP